MIGDLCRFRGGPHRFPSSKFLVGLLFLSDLTVSFLAGSFQEGPEFAILEAGFTSLLLGGFVVILLCGVQHSERILSTLSAIYGADVLVTLVALPFLFFGGSGTFFILLIVLWSLAILARILKIALGVGWALSWSLAVAFNFLSVGLVGLVFSSG